MSTYPSLARRAIEQRTAVAVPVPARSVPEPVSAALSEAITALGTDADAGETAFHAELGRSRAMIIAGSGAAEGSEPWAAAEMARSRLEAARGPSVFALAELDRLAIAESEAGHDDAAALIAQTQARVAALVRAQGEAMAALLP
ncbi:MAG: hypothetical protein ABL874_12755 [Sphingopyxis sp.]